MQHARQAKEEKNRGKSRRKDLSKSREKKKTQKDKSKVSLQVDKLEAWSLNKRKSQEEDEERAAAGLKSHKVEPKVKTEDVEKRVPNDTSD